MKNNDAFDLTKFLMALLVVLIHIKPFGGNRPLAITRIAVPMFFMTSAYFLFGKIQRTVDEANIKSKIVKKYICRIITLYFAWFVVLSPVTIYVRKYYRLSFVNVLKRIFLDFFLVPHS